MTFIDYIVCAVKRSRLAVAFFLAGACLCLAQADVAEAFVSASGNLNYGRSTSKSSAGTSSGWYLSESYRATAGAELTKTIRAIVSVYWMKQTSGGSGGTSVTSSSVYPTLMMSFTPPMLNTFSFSHMRTDSAPSEGIRYTTTSTAMGFTTPKWKFIQPIGLSYSINKSFDGEKVRLIDTEYDSFRLNTAYGFNLLGGSLGTHYGYGKQVSKDKLHDLTGEDVTNNFGVSFSRGLWRGFNFSVGANYSDSESVYSSATPTMFETVATASTGWCTPCPGWSSSPALVDNNLATQASSIDLLQGNWGMGVGFTLQQTIHKLYLKIIFAAPAVEFNEEQFNIPTYNFNWQVESSNDNFTWTAVAGLLVSYNSIDNRFEFTFLDTTAQYFRIVSTDPAAGAGLQVTEIKAFKNLTSSLALESKQQSNNKSHTFSLNGSPTPKTNFSYGFSYATTEGVSSGGIKQTSYSLGHGINLMYMAHPKYLTLNSSLSMSEAGLDGQKGASEGRALNLSAQSKPLNSISMTASYNYNEGYSFGKKTNDMSSIYLGSSLALYRGVSLYLGVSDSKSNSYVAGGGETSSFAYSDRWIFVPWSTVTAGFNHSYSESKSSDNTSVISEVMDAFFTYRPISSWIFSARFDIEPNSSQSYALSTVITSKMHASLNAGFRQDSRSYSGTLSWGVLPKLSLDMNYAKSITSSGESNFIGVNANIIIR